MQTEKNVHHEKLLSKTAEAKADMAAGRGHCKGIALKPERTEGEPKKKRAKKGASK